MVSSDMKLKIDSIVSIRHNRPNLGYEFTEQP